MLVKKLKFNHQFAQAIIDGHRNNTIRIDDKGIAVGDRVQLVDKVSSSEPQLWVIPGELIIESVQEFRLGKLPRAVAEQAELGSETQTSTYDFLRRFYGDAIHDDTIIKVIGFTYAPYSQPIPYMDKKSASDGDDLTSVKLFADGGSRGNPGPSAFGFVILDDETDQLIEGQNKYLGITTNNQAEYHGVISGLEWCRQHNVQTVAVYLDSLLVVNQLNGLFKVKNRDLWPLYETAKQLKAAFKTITFTHVPRELNKLADAEVNKALDAVKGDEALQ